MAEAYRDPRVGVRTRMEKLRSEIAMRQERLTEGFWTQIPVELAERIRADQEASEPKDDTLDGLQRAEMGLEDLRSALDEAIEMVPELEAGQRIVPETAPDPEPRGESWQVSLAFAGLYSLEREVAGLEQAVRKVVSSLGRVESIEPLGRHGLRARFAAMGAPFSFLAEVSHPQGQSAPEVFLTLATSVAKGAPRLRMGPEELRHTWFMKVFRLVKDVELGNPSFDGLFLIDAELEDARRLLTRDVRTWLLDLARDGIPTVRVEGGVAEIRWSFEPTERAVEDAVRILASIRAVPVHVQLLREGA